MTDQVFKVKRGKLLQASLRAEAAVLLSALIHYRFSQIPIMNLISLMIILIGVYYFVKRMFIRYSKDYRERVEDKEAKELFQTVGWLAIFIHMSYIRDRVAATVCHIKCNFASSGFFSKGTRLHNGVI